MVRGSFAIAGGSIAMTFNLRGDASDADEVGHD